MKLLSALPLAAFGQYYDYNFDDAGKFGALQVVVPGSSSSAQDNFGADAVHGSHGHGGNRRYCHTTGAGRSVYNWTSNSNGGYFATGRNVVECVGEELYCFIEERAQFGQIIGITAGCEQMMNHPAVDMADIQATVNTINVVKNNYNQEAARGGLDNLGLSSFYGIGGCLSMPAQNGHQFVHQKNQHTGTDGDNWVQDKWDNYYRYFHGGFGQNQCLRFPKRNGESSTVINAPGNLLPFGVSVCRACCIAEFIEAGDPTGLNANSADVYNHICNYPPDQDSVITDRTNDQYEEIVPRFDMNEVAGNNYMDGNDNNLFVHASQCANAGRARGCRIDGSNYVCSGTGGSSDSTLCP